MAFNFCGFGQLRMYFLIFLCVMLVRVASSGLEQPGREADDQPISSAEVRNVCSCTCTLRHAFMPRTMKNLPLSCRRCYMVSPFCSCWFDRRNNVWKSTHYGNPHINCFSLLLVWFQFLDCLLPYEFFLIHAQVFIALNCRVL